MSTLYIQSQSRVEAMRPSKVIEISALWREDLVEPANEVFANAHKIQLKVRITWW